MANRILITGGTGFAGSHLLELLAADSNNEIHITSFSTPDPQFLQWLTANQIHQVNLLDKEAIFELCGELQPTQVYHLAALAEVGSSFENAEKIILDNIKLQLNLLQAIQQHAPSARVLVVGSGQEYDAFVHTKAGESPLLETDPLGPSNPYAVSKVSQDLLGLSYFYSYQLQVLRVRPFNHIGERQSNQFAVASFAQQIAKIEIDKQQQLSVGNLAAKRDISDVKDVVRAYQLVMQRGEPGEVYNVGSGTAWSMQQILDTLISFSTSPIQVVTDQARFRPIDIPAITADISKIRRLGWAPQIALENSLHRVLSYWREQVASQQ